MKTLHQIQSSDPFWFLSAHDKIAVAYMHTFENQRFTYREPSERDIASATSAGTIATRIHWVYDHYELTNPNRYESIWRTSLDGSYTSGISRGVTLNDFNPSCFVEVDQNLTRR